MNWFVLEYEVCFQRESESRRMRMALRNGLGELTKKMHAQDRNFGD